MTLWEPIVEGKSSTALGWNMDTQIINQIGDTQTEGAAYSTSHSPVPKSELHALWRHDSVILKGGAK